MSMAYDKEHSFDQISVLGCGWLGKPLAEELLSVGFKVKGSTTTVSKMPSLNDLGIIPYLIDLDKIDNPLAEFLFKSEIVVVNIPPRAKTKSINDYLEQLKILAGAIEKSSIKYVLFVSSTSVYAEDETFQEVDAINGPFGSSDKSKSLLEAEEIFSGNKNFETTVLRLSGLIAEDRHPATYLSNKMKIKNPDAPVNLIHRIDCISLILNIIQSKKFPSTINGCYPEHPKKAIYYTAICKEKGLAPPNFDYSEKSMGKTVSSKYALDHLGFKYIRAIY